MNEHIIIICSSCDKVILQCRCMSKDKKTVYELCDDCNTIPNTKLDKLESEDLTDYEI